MSVIKEIMLDRAAYEALKGELTATARGKFVAIKGGVLVGIYDSRLEAIKDISRRYGHVPVLVKKIG